MDFGYTLRTMRKAAGLSLRRLARQVGVSAAYLSQVERGALPSPTIPRLRDIAEALGVPAPYLVGLTDRLSAEILEFVNSVPEVAGFLRVARDNGMGSADFLLLAEIVGVTELDGLRQALGELRDRHATTRRPGRSFLAVTDFLDERLVWHELQARDVKELLSVLAEGIARIHSAVDPNILLNRLLRREREASTGIGNGLAIPHATMGGLSETVVSLATLRAPVDFGAVDGQKVSVVFLVVGCDASRGERLKLLARVAQLAASQDFVRSLKRVRSRGELIERVRYAESRAR